MVDQDAVFRNNIGQKCKLKLFVYSERSTLGKYHFTKTKNEKQFRDNEPLRKINHLQVALNES